MEDIQTIEEVVQALEVIIREAESGESALGYFAVLYQKVTRKVAEGIRNDFFDDGPRMEKLDVLFAKRYLVAYEAYRKSETLTGSWRTAFDQGVNFWPIVLQHLLLGINAHINLDLGIAAAETAKGDDIGSLQNDFNKINSILASLVDEVQEDLANIWPRLHWILKKVGGIDNLLVDFSMELARDGAWTFAESLAVADESDWPELIRVRDEKVTRNAGLILGHRFFVRILLAIVRLGEQGSVRERIQKLK